jgi:hypothetical protein
MPVGAAPAKAKLDFSAGGEARQGRSRVGDQRPRSSPRQPSGGAGALAPISRTTRSSVSLSVSPSWIEETVAVSCAGKSQAAAKSRSVKLAEIKQIEANSHDERMPHSMA